MSFITYVSVVHHTCVSHVAKSIARAEEMCACVGEERVCVRGRER